MMFLMFFSFALLIQSVNAGDGGLTIKLTDNTGSTIATSLQNTKDYLQVPAQHLTRAKDALPFRVVQVMQQEDLSAVSEQELLCVKDYLEREKSKDREQWIKDHDCNIMCGLFSAMAVPECLALIGSYFCAESIGLEKTKETFDAAIFVALPVGGYLAYKFANSYQPDQFEISEKINRVSQALRNKQKQD